MAPERLIGAMVSVTITELGTNSLFGVLADAPRIEPPQWELCGTDAYVWGPLMYPKRAARQNSGG